MSDSKWSISHTDNHMGTKSWFLVKKEPGKQSIYAEIPYETYADELLAQLQMAEIYNALMVKKLDDIESRSTE